MWKVSSGCAMAGEALVPARPSFAAAEQPDSLVPFLKRREKQAKDGEGGEQLDSLVPFPKRRGKQAKDGEGGEQLDSLVPFPKRRGKQAKDGEGGEQLDPLVSAGKSQKAKKGGEKKNPVQRSKFATAATPVCGEQRRKELGRSMSTEGSSNWLPWQRLELQREALPARP